MHFQKSLSKYHCNINVTLTLTTNAAFSVKTISVKTFVALKYLSVQIFVISRNFYYLGRRKTYIFSGFPSRAVTRMKAAPKTFIQNQETIFGKRLILILKSSYVALEIVFSYLELNPLICPSLNFYSVYLFVDSNFCLFQKFS